MADDGKDVRPAARRAEWGYLSRTLTPTLAERGRVVATVVTDDDRDIDQFDVAVEGD